VTLPFTLLLFDVWPLRRLRSPNVLWEKLPLCALSAAAAYAAYAGQRAAGAVSTTTPLATRIANSLISYAVYIRQTVWPTRLSLFYPYGHTIAAWKAGVAFLLLSAITILAIWTLPKRPYLAAGWFWYLGTMVPVIGLLTVGADAHSDHFTYVPMVGLTMMAAWGGADLMDEWPGLKSALAATGAVFCLACLGLGLEASQLLV
jgi:hypothetical protein